MAKITEMFAFVIHEGDNPDDEGLMGFKGPNNQWFPMVGADMQRVHQLMPIADQIANQIGKTYKILRFQLVSEVKRRPQPEIGG